MPCGRRISCSVFSLVSFFLLVSATMKLRLILIKSLKHLKLPSSPSPAFTSRSPPKTLSRRRHLKLQLKGKTVNDDSEMMSSQKVDLHQQNSCNKTLFGPVSISVLFNQSFSHVQTLFSFTQQLDVEILLKSFFFSKIII